MRQLLAEGLVLALAGGAAGLLLAHACLPLVARMQPTMRDHAAVLQPFSISISIDWRVLAFAAGITLVTAVLFALSPALRCARTDVATVLRGGRTVTGGIVARNAIVAAQVALCTLVLVSAALLVETLQRMSSMDPGFDRDHVVTFTIDPGLRNYRPEQSRALSQALLEKAAALPGVRGAAIAGVGLMRGTGMKTTAGAAGTQLVATDFLNSSVNNVTPGYFVAMGMQILAGQMRQVELSDDLDLEASGGARIVEIEALLDRLASIDPQLRTIVEMRIFEGFSIPDIAAQLNCGARTVDRRWAFARKWLEHQLMPARP